MRCCLFLPMLASLLAGTATAAPQWGTPALGVASTKPVVPAVDTIDDVLAALYAGVSGDAGAPRDVAGMVRVFVPDAQLHVTTAGVDGVATTETYDVPGFVALNERRLASRGFHEREIHREVTDYGAVAHVWSVFETRRSRDDAEPYARGANSLQLLRTPQGWRVLSVTWDIEGPDRPLRPRFPVAAAAGVGR